MRNYDHICFEVQPQKSVFPGKYYLPTASCQVTFVLVYILKLANVYFIKNCVRQSDGNFETEVTALIYYKSVTNNLSKQTCFFILVLIHYFNWYTAHCST